MKDYKITINFTRDILGSQPSNEEIKMKYITAKMMTGRTGMSAEIAQERVKEEIDNLKNDSEYQDKIKDLIDKSITIFNRDENGKPAISDVQLRGFFKDAFAFINKENKILTKKSGDAYSTDEYPRKWIGDRISFEKRYILLPETNIDIFERPIRCKTMQGERISITASERIKSPIEITFNVTTTDDVDLKILKLILDRGKFKGIGQWANAQFGNFTYTILEV